MNNKEDILNKSLSEIYKKVLEKNNGKLPEVFFGKRKEDSKAAAWLFADMDTIIDCFSGSDEEDGEG